ncbi:cytochrome P450 3A5 [Cercophora scortea]|uniref:Cytochrome P450 3A5 n=1 Tax=Cercophora scortea TaxID=314031 RepID=A0AAE0IF28_9PEZI|nr:cytochrome P450 3A5 [Cercophora scortea]
MVGVARDHIRQWQTMDLQLTAVLSLLEVVVLTGFQRAVDLAQTSPLTLIKAFFTHFLLQYGALKVYRVVIVPHYLSPLRHIPGPTNNFPLIGQMKNLLTADSPSSLYVEWGNRWPDAPFIRHLGLANMELLLVNTVEAHKEVFQTHAYDFIKPEFMYRYVADISGRGLLFSEGEEHKRQRRSLGGLFSIPNLKRILPVFQEKAGDLSAMFDREIGGNSKATVEVQDAFSKLTMDVVGVTILGVHLGNLNHTDPQMDFLKCFDRALNQPPLGALISFINTVVPIRRWLPIEANRGFERATREVRRMLLECVRQRSHDLDEAARKKEAFVSANLASGGRDLLTMMIEDRNKFRATTDEAPLTDEETVEHILNFLSAGHETTSGALTWAAFALATHPKVQDKLRLEITTLLSTTTSPSYTDLESLRYLHNFCREVLRLYAPAFSTYRQAARDLVICGQHIPKGTPLVGIMLVTNLSERVWGADVTSFVPERWEEDRSPYAFSTFMHGPRICVGKNYALLEFKAMLVEVLMKFRFGMTDELEALGGKLPPLQNPSLSYRPRDGMRVVVERL